MVEKYKKINVKNKKENDKLIKKENFKFLIFTFNLSFLSFNISQISLLALLLIPGIIGLIHSGFPITDDGNWMIIRFSAFYDALRHGQFPVRFLPRLNHGYGYPVADFNYPLFMYIGVPIHFMKFTFVNTVKIILGGSFILSALFTFFWLKKIFNTVPSFLGAFVYGLFPYHLYDIYQRGSVGEVLALCIVPFILWQIERKSLAWISVGIALLILAHNSLALVFLPVIIVYMLIRKVFFIKYIVLSILLSLGLSMFFWLPALYDKQFTVFDKTQVSDFSRYFLTSVNFGLLGIFPIAVIVISVYFLIRKFRASRNNSLLLFFLLITLISISLSSPYFSFVWNIVPLPRLVQFPFRFLAAAMIGISFLTSAVIAKIKTQLQIVIVSICIILLYSAASKYMFPSSYQTYPDGYYSTNQDTTTVKNEYLPIWVKKTTLQSPEKSVAVVKGNGSVSSITTANPNKIQFMAIIEDTSIIRVNTVYFPGWKVLVNNKEQPISYNNTYGVMDFNLLPGKYQVSATFGETPIRIVADIVSFLSFILILFLGFRFKHI